MRLNESALLLKKKIGFSELKTLKKQKYCILLIQNDIKRALQIPLQEL